MHTCSGSGASAALCSFALHLAVGRRKRNEQDGIAIADVSRPVREIGRHDDGIVLREAHLGASGG